MRNKNIRGGCFFTRLLLLFIMLAMQATVLARVQLIPDEALWHVDEQRKFVLINQDPIHFSGILEQGQYFETVLLGETTFLFSESQYELAYGISYTLIHSGSGSTYRLFFTPLPVVHISTPHTIVDEPRVPATFTLVESDGSKLESTIGVEYRGAYTQSLEKKSLRIEFWEDETGAETRDVQLLGMRSDDDWNLQAMFNEPLRFNNVIGFKLWGLIDKLYYAGSEPDARNVVDMKYVELFVNDDYRGIYALGERIDRKQLKLKKFKDGNIRGELYKAKTWTSATMLNGVSPFDNSQPLSNGWEYVYPKEDEKIDWNAFYNLLVFLTESSDTDFFTHYDAHFVTGNAINYLIFINLVRAQDNSGKNTFIARYKENEPYFYVAWDLDGTLGVKWDGTNDPVTNSFLSNGMYNRLLKDDSYNGFRSKLKRRWLQLRDHMITYDQIAGMMDIQHDFLKNIAAYEREEMRWESYEYDPAQLSYQKNWLADRLTYLDSYFEGLYTAVSAQNAGEKLSFYPGLVNENLTVIPAVATDFVIYSLIGRVELYGKLSAGENHIVLTSLQPGTYIFRLATGESFKFIKR